MVGTAAAEHIVLSDGDFPDASWTVEGSNGVEFEVGRVPTDGNPDAYRRARITMGAGGQMDLVNVSPEFLFDPDTQGAITGLSIAFDARRPPATGNELYVSVGIVQNGNYSELFGILGSASWEHWEFECIGLDDLDLEPGPVQFAFAFSGYTPFMPLSPAWEIGIDNFVVQI
jgi:hypothetical protein